MTSLKYVIEIFDHFFFHSGLEKPCLNGIFDHFHFYSFNKLINLNQPFLYLGSIISASNKDNPFTIPSKGTFDFTKRTRKN